LIAEHREIIGRSLDDTILYGAVADRDIFGQRGQDQEQREERQESIVCQQSGLMAGIILAVFLDDGKNEARQMVAALKPIDF
jgi:hypothetical protein